jgi:diguanylate cyclase (GGDEF)-like protein
VPKLNEQSSTLWDWASTKGRKANTAPTHDGNRQLRVVLLAVVYMLIWNALWFLSSNLKLSNGISLWYLPAGLTLAVLLEYGVYALPLPILAGLVAGLSIWPLAQWPYLVATSLLPPLAYYIITWALHRYRDGASYDNVWHFHGAQNVGVFIIAAAIAALLSALSGVSLHSFGGFLPVGLSFWNAVLGWWVGDFAGVATFTPVLLIFVFPLVRRFAESGSLRSNGAGRAVDCRLLKPLFWVQSFLSIVALVAVFWMPLPGGLTADPFNILLLLPALVWMIAKYGIRGAVLIVFLLELTIVAVVMAFGRIELILHYQIVMAAVAATGVIVGAMAQEKLTDTAMFRDLAKISNDFLWEFDATGQLRDLGGQTGKLTEIQPKGGHWESLIVSDQQECGFEALKLAIEGRQAFRQLVLRVRWPDQDSSQWVRVSGLPLFDEFGEFAGYRGTMADITAHKKNEALLQDYDRTLETRVAARVEERTRALAEVSLRNWRLANYDHLTSLPNRNLLFEHLRKGLEQSRRNRRLLAVLLIDLDGFKEVNDNFGHDTGDELLRQVATRLQRSVRATDTAARLGGDEFTVVLPGLEYPEAASVVAQKIVVQLAEPVSIGVMTVAVTASVGIAVYRPESPANLEMAMNLLKQADAAMYAAKKAGKNNWRFAEEARAPG